MLTARTGGFNLKYFKYLLAIYIDRLPHYHLWISSGNLYDQKVICIRKGEAPLPLAKFLHQTPKDMLPMINRIQFLYRRRKLRQFKVFCMTMLKINKKGIQCLRVNRQIRRKILQFI